MMSDVVIKFINLNQSCINKILDEKFGYRVSIFEVGSDIFCFEGSDFLHRVANVHAGYINYYVKKIAEEIGEYPGVNHINISYRPEMDRYIIAVKGETHEQNYIGGFNGNRSFGGSIDGSFDPEFLKRYCEKYTRDTTHLRIPKTFDVYSGYSRDGRLRTVVHWQDGVKTDVYLQNEDFDDIYLAIAYCYVKRKFGTISHFKRIVERNTREVTGNARRFIYGGDSTLLIATAHLINIYDQVALYLAISYLGDTDQWLTEEDMKRLEDSINE